MRRPPRRPRPNVRQRALSAFAAFALLASCGGDNDGREMLTGDEAAEASVGAALSTALALSTMFLEIEIAIDEAPSTGTAAGGRRGTVSSACEGGGNVSVSCEVNGRGETTIALHFSDCRAGNALGRRRTRDGRVSIRALDPTLCLTGVLRDGLPFTLQFDRFSSTVTERQRTLGRFTADLTENVTFEEGGCLTRNGRRSVSGSLTIRVADRGIDLSASTPGLSLEVGATGSPCRQGIGADGTLEVNDRANGQRLAQDLDDVRVLLSETAGDVLLEVDGRSTSDCLGEVHFDTTLPVRVGQLGECPSAGILALAFADGTTGEVTFAGGGFDLDLGTNGSVDRSVDDCREATLARCR